MVAVMKERARTEAVCQPVSTQARIQSAGQQARDDYERVGKDRSERERCLVLQHQMQQWQREGVPTGWQVAYLSGWHAAVLEEEGHADRTAPVREVCAMFQSFGALLLFVRKRSGVLRQEVVEQFAVCRRPLNCCILGNLERDERYPVFAELVALYRAFTQAGVVFRPEEQAAYVLLARAAMERNRRKRERVTGAEWKRLEAELAALDGHPAIRMLPVRREDASEPVRPPHAEPDPLVKACSQLLPRMSEAVSELAAALAQLSACVNTPQEGGATWQ
jgi:hypothetical protein